MHFGDSATHLLHNWEHGGEMFGEAVLKIDYVRAENIVAKHNPSLFMSVSKGVCKNIVHVRKARKKLTFSSYFGHIDGSRFSSYQVSYTLGKVEAVSRTLNHNNSSDVSILESDNISEFDCTKMFADTVLIRND
jgi:hypothetical protein